ncbi:hypothetical protein ABH994_005569 [Bradyrhizobium yuanmingense]
MTQHCNWRLSRALHRAINDQCFADIEVLLDENVEWAIYGPVDMFPFLGSRQGKHAVLEVIRNIAGIVQVQRFDREMTILGLDSAASIVRCSLISRASKTPIAVRLASSHSSTPPGSSRCARSSTPSISSNKPSAAQFIFQT